MSDPGTEQIPYRYEFVVDAAYPSRVSRAVFLAGLRSPLVWVVYLVIAVVLVILTLSGGSPWLLVLWLVAVAIILGLRYRRILRTLRTAFPVGKVLRSGFGADRFAIANGADSSIVSYANYDEVRVDGDMVWLRAIAPKRRSAYPRALFPDAEIERMRAAFAARNSVNRGAAR